MIIRVQTNVGIWRISNINPSSTISDVTKEIAITRPHISYTQPLSLDAGGKQTIGNSNTLDELGLSNGDMIYCRVSTNNDNTGTSSESRKRKHNSQYKNSSSTLSDRSRGLPMGTFQGLKIYRNSFNESESFDKDHVTVENLIPDDCSRALVSTFDWPDDKSFVEDVFDADHLNIQDLIFVRDDKLQNNEGRARVGAAVVDPINNITSSASLYYLAGQRHISDNSTSNNKRNWHYITCAPHTGGVLHGKLFLLRTPVGLRVVVSGNNFYREQWESHRDILFVQDFPTHVLQLTDPKTGKHYSGQFEDRLREYLSRTTKCECPVQQANIKRRIEALFESINFSSAKARFVYSFPSSLDERGGWKQLANTVRELRDELEGTDEESDSDESMCERDTHSNTGRRSILPIMYATSGSIGHLKPDFCLQQYRCMLGDDRGAPKTTEWNELLSRSDPQIGILRILWPSHEVKALALGLVNDSRPWFSSIPDNIKQKCFYDPPPGASYGRTHGKVYYTSIPIENGSSRTSVLYVGSHNVSEAAWGKRGNQMSNVEIGVVLVTNSPEIDEQWRNSLPCPLPRESESSEEYNYRMKRSDSSPALQVNKSSVSASAADRVIDLCDSD